MWLDILWASYRDDPSLPPESSETMRGIQSAFLADQVASFPIEFICSARDSPSFLFARSLHKRVRNWSNSLRASDRIYVVPCLRSDPDFVGDESKEFQTDVDNDSFSDFLRTVVPSLKQLVWYRHRLVDGSPATYYIVIICPKECLDNIFGISVRNGQIIRQHCQYSDKLADEMIGYSFQVMSAPPSPPLLGRKESNLIFLK